MVGFPSAAVWSENVNWKIPEMIHSSKKLLAPYVTIARLMG